MICLYVLKVILLHTYSTASSFIALFFLKENIYLDFKMSFEFILNYQTIFKQNEFYANYPLSDM